MDLETFLEETHPCCVKEREAAERREYMTSLLRSIDPVRKREEARRAGYAAVKGSKHSCGCSAHAHQQLYPALQQLQQSMQEMNAAVNAENGAAQEDRDELDDEDEEFLNFGLDDPTSELAQWRRQQMELMEQQSKQIERLHAAGYGFQRAVSLLEFEGLLASEACVVAHFYDAYSEADARLDLVLMDLAATYVGTMFVRINYEEMGHPTPGLNKTLRFTGKPRQGLICCRGGDVVCESRSDYAEFMSQSVVYTDDVTNYLEHAGVLRTEPPAVLHTEATRQGLTGAGAARLGMSQGTDGDGDEDVYDCGVAGCQKRFAHTHIADSTGSALLPNSDAGDSPFVDNYWKL